MSSDLKNVLVIAGGILILSWLFGSLTLAGIALAILIFGLFSEDARRIVSLGWMKFAHRVGAFNTKVLLGLIFYAILTPLALLRRFIAIFFKKPTQKTSNCQDRNHLYTPQDFEQMW